MRGPNKEQVLAIEHQGGVLLNAGAGSGKTFVLIEHIHFLINSFLDKLGHLPAEVQEKELKIYLNKIVLMTFTNDAAAEIRERLFKKFENQESEIIVNALSSLTVSTIHGFCLKLIKQGLIVGAPTDIEISDEFSINKKIEVLVNKWFRSSGEVNPLLLKNYDSVVSAMQFVFKSPELRFEWYLRSKNQNLVIDEEGLLWNIFTMFGVSDFWKTKLNHSEVDTYSDKAWYGLSIELDKLKSEPLSFDILNQIFLEYKKIKTLRFPKKVPAKWFDYFEAIKSLRDICKKYCEDLTYYSENTDVFKDWWQTLSNLFRYVEDRYYRSPGMSFSDLEYLIIKSLHESPETAVGIQSNFSYFIVDEYQDTSMIQFDILKYAITGDYKKLFCVGDRKQAIYGFRGGELEVFNQTSTQVPVNLMLANNYRSEEGVVNFNNNFFDFLFKLGRNYEGSDKFQVKVDHQKFPDTKDSGLGSVYQLNSNYIREDLKKADTEFINSNEAKVILSQIIKMIAEGEEDICILYKNLNPSKFLIEELIRNNISFTAQVKIPFGEDPVFTLFSTFVDFSIEVDRGSEDSLKKAIKYYQFFIGKIVSLYYGRDVQITEERYIQYHEMITTMGLKYSFWALVFDLGLSNSAYKENSQKIDNIIDSCAGSIDQVWSTLKTLSSQKYSTKFFFGTKSKVTIMTTHASKGLQFDNVLLGGVHTNGKAMPQTEVMGSLPGSFKWSSDIYKKKLHRSPQYIYEQILKSHKEFSESKRLLYVAATRAVKSLGWVSLLLNGKEQSSAKESWIHPLREFHDGVEDIEVDSEQLLSDKLPSRSPMFYIDQLGISVKENKPALGLVSELSVTKLANLAKCPRKFYFSQILKLDDDWSKYTQENAIETYSRQGVSDTKRGIEIHKKIENFLMDENLVELDSDLEVVAKEISKFSSHTKLIEKEIKFSLFGQMITGIPDLVLVKNNVIEEIWDFKTGLCDEDDEKSYYFQMMTYLYGLKKLGYKLSDKINMKLILIDQKTILLESISAKEVEEGVFSTWSKLSTLSVKNLDHCARCVYGNLCH